MMSCAFLCIFLFFIPFPLNQVFLFLFFLPMKGGIKSYAFVGGIHISKFLSPLHFLPIAGGLVLTVENENPISLCSFLTSTNVFFLSNNRIALVAVAQLWQNCQAGSQQNSSCH